MARPCDEERRDMLVQVLVVYCETLCRGEHNRKYNVAQQVVAPFLIVISSSARRMTDMRRPATNRAGAGIACKKRHNQLLSATEYTEHGFHLLTHLQTCLGHLVLKYWPSNRMAVPLVLVYSS